MSELSMEASELVVSVQNGSVGKKSSMAIVRVETPSGSRRRRWRENDAAGPRTIVVESMASLALAAVLEASSPKIEWLIGK